MTVAKQERDTEFGKDKLLHRAVSQGSVLHREGQAPHARFSNDVKRIELIPGCECQGSGDSGSLRSGPRRRRCVYGDSYDLRIGEGTASSFAINSSRIATVENIIVQQKKGI